MGDAALLLQARQAVVLTSSAALQQLQLATGTTVLQPCILKPHSALSLPAARATGLPPARRRKWRAEMWFHNAKQKVHQWFDKHSVGDTPVRKAPSEDAIAAEAATDAGVVETAVAAGAAAAAAGAEAAATPVAAATKKAGKRQQRSQPPSTEKEAKQPHREGEVNEDAAEGAEVAEGGDTPADQVGAGRGLPAGHTGSPAYGGRAGMMPACPCAWLTS